jgi:hypothetical protein
MDTTNAWAIATICLYSTGHWIGGTIALVVTLLPYLSDLSRK